MATLCNRNRGGGVEAATAASPTSHPLGVLRVGMLQVGRGAGLAKAKDFTGADGQALPDLHFIARNLDGGGELRGAIKL